MIPPRRTTAAATTALVLSTAGGLLTATATPAAAAVTCASPVYRQQFFANVSFSGTPRKTVCDWVTALYADGTESAAGGDSAVIAPAG